MGPTKKWVDLSEATKLTNLSYSTLWRAYSQGEIQYFKSSRSKKGRVLLNADSLEKWINSHTQPTKK